MNPSKESPKDAAEPKLSEEPPKNLEEALQRFEALSKEAKELHKLIDGERVHFDDLGFKSVGHGDTAAGYREQVTSKKSRFEAFIRCLNHLKDFPINLDELNEVRDQVGAIFDKYGVETVVWKRSPETNPETSPESNPEDLQSSDPKDSSALPTSKQAHLKKSDSGEPALFSGHPTSSGHPTTSLSGTDRKECDLRTGQPKGKPAMAVAEASGPSGEPHTSGQSTATTSSGGEDAGRPSIAKGGKKRQRLPSDSDQKSFKKTGD